jgi:hypothetical protein
VNVSATAVTLAAVAPTILASGTTTTPATAAPGYVWTSLSNGTVWVMTFVSATGNTVTGHSIADGVYTATLNSTQVTAVSGGSPMTTTRATDTFYRLYGDFNADKKVNSTDSNKYSTMIAAGAPTNGATGYLPYFDFNSDGRINTTDSNKFSGNVNTSWSGFTPTI